MLTTILLTLAFTYTLMSLNVLTTANSYKPITDILQFHTSDTIVAQQLTSDEPRDHMAYCVQHITISNITYFVHVFLSHLDTQKAYQLDLSGNWNLPHFAFSAV